MTPRLSPPPKVVSPVGRPPTEEPLGVSERRRGVGYWLTAAVFVILIVVAVGVFLLLPGWVAERSTDSAVEQSEGEALEPAMQPDTPAMQPDTKVEATTRVMPKAEPAAESIEQLPATAGESTRVVPTLPNTHPATEQPTPARAEAISTSRSSATSDVFGRAMATGLAALDRGELETARSAFEQAETLSPGSPEVADGRTRVEAAEQLRTITGHRQRAVALEEGENWASAQAEYAAVLELDPAIRFARQGETRAGGRAELDQAVEEHLSRPDRLTAEAVLEEARQVLERAREIAYPGPRLSTQIDRLDRQILVASTPVRVVLISDGLTEILVYRVGQMGRFERRELDLRPGTYTVVGAREGFRDVRHQLEVAADGSTGALTVRCEEKV